MWPSLVVNENDAGKVTLSSIQPEAGSAISAQLTDPDGGITNVEWKWQYAATPSVNDADFGDIVDAATSGSTVTMYIPSDGDAARTTYLRAVATYTDAHGVDKEAKSSASNYRVQEEDADNVRPSFPDQDINTPGPQTGQTRYVVEETKGAPLVANKDGTPSDTGDDPVLAAFDSDDNPETPGSPPAHRKLTYTLTGPDASLFTIASTTAQVSLRSGVEVDFETRATYTVSITATDPSLESETMTLAIKVVDKDESPTLSKRGLQVLGPRPSPLPRTARETWPRTPLLARLHPARHGRWKGTMPATSASRQEFWPSGLRPTTRARQTITRTTCTA